MIAVRNPFSREARAATVVILDGGVRIELDEIQTPAEGEAILAELSGAIASIREQLDTGLTRPDDPGWRSRADLALKMKARVRVALRARIAELQQAKRRSRLPRPERSENRRTAFINAAEQMLDAELFTEIWARAQEMSPAAFVDMEARHA